MINQAIKAFLNKFKYLNDDGKRDGMLFNFFRALDACELFSNKALTNKLELLAHDLIFKLTQLIENDLAESKKCEIFYKSVKAAFEKSSEARVELAEVKTVYTSYPGYYSSDERTTINYDFKNPYKTSKFEQELMNGLNAAIDILREKKGHDHDLNQLDKKFGALLYEIEQFSPKDTIFMEDRSYIP